MIVDIQNISKSFNSIPVLSGISFHIEAGEKCALIGTNGSGKTTLLRLLAGEETPDEGMVYRTTGLRIGYLPQIHDIHSKLSLYEYVKEAKKDLFEMEERLRGLEEQMKNADGEVLDGFMRSYSSITHEFERRNGFAAESEIRGVIKGLGFAGNDPDRLVSEMSGGEKTRAALARLLIDDYDLLMLDEPTNHLDLHSVEWLENFLASYNGALLIVSHDRYFLDKLVTKVFEIENHQMMAFEGNYTVFGQKKAQIRESQIKAWLNQQNEIRHQEAVIEKLKSFNREKSIKRAESRIKALAKIERLEKPVELKADMHLKFNPAALSGNDVLTVTGLSKSFGEHNLFEDLSFDIKRSEKVALIGDNGTGKSTILKIVNQYCEPDAGEFRYGSNVYADYYDQEQQVLEPENTVFEEIAFEYPDLTNTEVRNVCAGFLFTGDDVFKQVKHLSGGEKARLSLAKLMLSGANLLILDEPTNHLDIVSREVLEDAIREYSGTVLYVSHDRYFINRTASRILELEGGKLIEYKGNYDYYAEKKAERKAKPDTESDKEQTVSENATQNETDWKEYKKEQARVRKRANDLRKTEEQIDALEQKIKRIDEQILLPENASNPLKLTELCEEKASGEEELERLYQKWEELSDADTC